MAKIVQIKHPMTGLYVRINVDTGKITGYKKTLGPYKGLPVARGRKVRSAPAAPTTFTREQAKEAACISSTRTRSHAREKQEAMG